METASAQNTSDRLWDWKAALLVILIVQVSSLRLSATEWAPSLYFTQTMGLAGVLVGLALGYSRFSRQAVVRLAAGYTVVLLPLQLISAVEKTGWLWLDLLEVLRRLFFSLDQFIQNKPVHDYLFFVSIVTLTYWGIGLAAGYWLTRHMDFSNAVLPSGLAILTVQAFDAVQTKRVWELAFFLLFSLLLLGRMYFLKNRTFWKKTNFLLTDDVVTDLERGTVVIAIVMVSIAWFLPTRISDLKPAAKAWREFSQPIYDKFTNAVSALESPYAESNAGSDFYSKALALGQQAAVGDTPVFKVEITSRQNEFVPVRSYWKGRNYNLYINGRWTTAEDATETFVPAINELVIENPQNRNEMGLTFITSAKQQSLLYTPAETIWVSKVSEIQASPASGGEKDVTAWVSTNPLSKGNQYKVRALIADPSIEELRAAGTAYPAWVTEKYLQVPDKIAPQLKGLALEITASHNTPYDKAEAITSHLRTRIKYQTTIGEPLPENLDPVLWFLFDYKQGFCMYYASAETLMLRSIGIPARMAVGFVEGSYDEMKWEYTVTYKDSHAWPEVYFPGVGWVEFEPTSSQFPIERPETKDNSDQLVTGPESEGGLVGTPTAIVPLQERPKPLLDDEVTASTSVGIKWYQSFLIPSLVLLALGFGIFIVRHYSLNDRLPVYLAHQYEKRGNVPPRWLSRWVRWTILSPIERAFQSVNLSLRWLGQPQAAHITSKERAEALIKCLPEAEDQTLSLLQEYHTAIYTPHDGDLPKARKAALSILLKSWTILLKKTLQFHDSRYNELK